jgi:hypothetical protein
MAGYRFPEDSVVLKNIFNSGKCMLGFHQGDWQYEEPQKCLKFQVCTHCAKRSTKIEHTWGEWGYLAEGDCQQVRVCARCGEQEAQTVHVWGKDVYYTKDNDCSTVNFCERCKAEKPSGTIHVWGEWVYTSPDRCNQKQKCSRCGSLSSEEREQHAWEGWQYSSFYKGQVIVCQHCGLMPLNFDNSTNYTMTMQDVDRLYGDLLRASTVRQIVTAIRENKGYFSQPLNPVMNSYQDFVMAHMPEECGRETYKILAGVIQLISATGIDTVLPYLNEIQSQSAQNPWQLVLSKIQEADAYAKRLANLDRALIGHWRYTESMGDSGFSVVTDYHMTFAGDGSYAEYQHSVSAAMGTDRRSAPLYGTWWSENRIVHVDFGPNGKVDFNYQFSGGYLVTVISGKQQFWERTG